MGGPVTECLGDFPGDEPLISQVFCHLRHSPPALTSFIFTHCLVPNLLSQ